MYQMKEQDKTPEKQLNDVEVGNLPEKEFRIMIVKMIQDLRKRMEAKIKKMQEKKAGVAILISDKTDFKIKNATRDKEGHYIMIKGSIQEEDGIRDVAVTGVQTCALPIYSQKDRKDEKAEGYVPDERTR